MARFYTYLILLANVLQAILHNVLVMTKVKIFCSCITIDFGKDYFRYIHILAQPREGDRASPASQAGGSSRATYLRSIFSIKGFFVARSSSSSLNAFWF